MKAPRERGLMPSTGTGVGVLASILLALLTISVFYVLQDYGPESAIRKYNEAVQQGDVVALDQISAQPGETLDGQWLAAKVRDLLAAGGRLRLDTMDRQPTTDLAGVEYVLPGQQPVPFLFVVTKENHAWKVNPEATRKVFNQVTGRD
ncbi:MAG: hypothetical protein ACYC96_13640 [Fimbriimonadaceae bacterium]